jgi:methionyl-tRNA formyltransferase
MSELKPGVIFMGTPEFAVPALERLAARREIDLALIVTQPDRPAGRGRKLLSPPVKDAAGRLGLPIVQTATLRDPDVRQRIVGIAPDLVVVAAFGMILGTWILELPACGCVNLHASLLPRYRGANPIAAAIAEGEETTGVTLMRMDRGLDTGAVYAMAEDDIRDNDTTETLTQRLADAAGELLDRRLADLLDGSLVAIPQGDRATLTRPMVKDDGWLDFWRPAAELERQVRAMWPWPRAWTTTPNGERIQVQAASVSRARDSAPGTVIHDGGRVLVSTGGGSLVLVRIQLPGGRPLEGPAIASARTLQAGTVLGTTGRPDALRPLVAPVD